MIAALLGSAGRAGLGASAAIDATIVVLGAGLVTAVVVAVPYAGQQGLSTFLIGLRSAYVFRDVLILAALIHVATVVRWSTSAGLLGAGVLGLLTYDALFRLGHAGTWLGGSPADAAWLLYLVAIGAAALVPSMTRVRVDGDATGRVVTIFRLGVVILAAVLPMGAILVGWSQLPPARQHGLVLAATAMLVLVLARVMDTSIRLRQHLGAERVIQEATADLVQALDPEAVVRIVRQAAQRLSPPGTRTTIVADRTATPSPSDDRPAAGDAVLTFPLSTAPLDRQQPLDVLPAMSVQTGRTANAALRSRLAVLAAQGAQALERIRLNTEITRHVRDDYFRAVVHNSADVILIVDDADRIRYASPSANSMFQLAEVAGARLPDLFPAEGRAAVAAKLQRSRRPAGCEPTASDDWIVRRPAEDPVEIQVLCRDLRADPAVAGLVVTLHDVTTQRRLERELTRRADTDALTGLSNRRAFIENLETLTGGPAAADVGLFFVDVDDLKATNDRYGHPVGDALLEHVGRRLLAQTTGGGRNMSTWDLAARLGGDEFAMMLVDRSGPEIAGAAQELVADLSQPAIIDGCEVRCGVSVGVADTALAAGSSDLMRQADIALYAAKHAGKRCWRHYEPSMCRAAPSA